MGTLSRCSWTSIQHGVHFEYVTNVFVNRSSVKLKERSEAQNSVDDRLPLHTKGRRDHFASERLQSLTGD